MYIAILNIMKHKLMKNLPTLVITGGTGLVGTRLIQRIADHYQIYILTRGKSEDTNQVKYIKWNIKAKEIELDKLPSEVDIIINLVGAGIADKRWTEARKQVLIDSRVKSTEFLFEVFKSRKVKTYIGASAIGYYGDRGEELLTADSDPGKDGFLSKCCVLWEESSQLFKPVVDHHYILRIGIVLSEQGGALPKLILPSKLGGAGYFGDGSAYYSWIHIDDLCNTIEFLINESPPSRAYNGVSPLPIPLKEFMRGIKKVYAPYALLLPIPVFAVKLAMGEMVSMLTNSDRVIPQHLEAAGHKFEYADIDRALRHIKEEKVELGY